MQMDVIAPSCPDRGVGAGAAPHVDQPGRRGRQESVEKLKGPSELQARLTLAEETITFKAQVVMCGKMCGERIVNHRRSLARSLGQGNRIPAPTLPFR